MALESVTAETVIQSNDDNDLEDGEIPSDEDDEPVVIIEPAKPSPEPPKPPPVVKTETSKNKDFDKTFGKSKRTGSIERLNRQKVTSEDWAGDLEKAIKAALDNDKKSKDNSSKSKNKNRNRKRSREEKIDERSKDQKKKRLSDEENTNEDDDEMMFVRGASPIRRSPRENSSPRHSDHDNYNSGSDYDDRPGINRHRDDNKRGGGRWPSSNQHQERNKISATVGRRAGKNEQQQQRGGKNNKLTRAQQLRNERNRRNQVNDHNQDPDAICVYYMQGKCHRGDDCPFSHNALPPRKMELCKFYLMDCCAKRDKCLYMHHDFPCKFHHTGLNCNSAENCKFSHQPMSEQVKSILLKHLETAPKEILGNFPRLSREGAMYLINSTEKNMQQGPDNSGTKIPSLFELKVNTPNDMVINMEKDEVQIIGEEPSMSRDNNGTLLNKERKYGGGKKTRWGSDADRVPIQFNMIAQLGVQLANNNQESTAVPSINFYGEVGPNAEQKPKEVKEVPVVKQKESLIPKKDVDLRQLLANAAPKTPQIVNVADEVAILTKSKLDEESDRDEDTDLIIEVPVDDEDKDKAAGRLQEMPSSLDNIIDHSRNAPLTAVAAAVVADTSQEVPMNLPKKTQELYMRIQQQQREAQDSYKNLENNENQEINQEDWYSDDNDDDDDDDDDQLTIVLKDIQKEEEEEQETKQEIKEEPIPQPSSIPQPAAIVDKLGDLSKIDISMEVSKLLSSIKAQSSSNSLKHEKDSKSKKETNLPISTHVDIKTSSAPEIMQFPSNKVEIGNNSPRLSPNRSTSLPIPPAAIIQQQPTVVSRDPRMSRDPRQRNRDEPRPQPVVINPAKPVEKEMRSLKLEMSIYSSGIIAQDDSMDTDLRGGSGSSSGGKLDQDHRRKDMDFRCFAPAASFGDTDLRLTGGGSGHYQAEASKSGDIDLRQMLSLPFKPVPSHVPCTEIDASYSSHPPMPYKVYVVDIPRPDYTGLKLTRNDAQVRYDPRLRKIFRLSRDEIIADSPMSPPPVKMLDTPKSPPLIRTDPRRKALEVTGHPQPKIIPTTVQQHPVHELPNIATMGMNMASSYMQAQSSVQVQSNMQAPVMQNLGPPPLMMQNPQIINSLGPMMRDASGSMGNNGNAIAPNIRMGPSMGPNQQQHQGQSQNQFDPRFNNQRTPGVGLLGAGPQKGPASTYNQEIRAQYDDRYPNESFNNYSNNPNNERGDPRNYKNNAPMEEQNYIGAPEWNGSQNRQNRKDRRRTTRGKFGGLGRRKDLSL